MAICQLAVARFCQMANNLLMANRIREIRKSADITLEELAERTGLSTSFLSRMEADKRGLKLENAMAIAKALGKEVEEITDEFDHDDTTLYANVLRRAVEKRRSKPVGDVANLAIHGGMGLGSVEEVGRNDEGDIYADRVNGFWSFPDAVKAGWRNMPSVYSVPVTGDSMEPTLTSGSYVFIDMTHTVPSPPDIYACDYGDGLMIKRLQLVPRTDKIMVMSDNERYGDYELRRDDLRVYGRVVAWFQWRG